MEACCVINSIVIALTHNGTAKFSHNNDSPHTMTLHSDTPHIHTGPTSIIDLKITLTNRIFITLTNNYMHTVKQYILVMTSFMFISLLLLRCPVLFAL